VHGLVNPFAREFRAIPYASPPTGPLRWRSPVPVPAWAPSTIDATNDPPGCIQHCGEPPHACPLAVSENCLFVNVFTPRLAALNASGPVPVVVFTHGGDFKDGWPGGSLYNGTEVVRTQSVVVVTVGYRLGALGFAFTGTGPDDLPGNLGLEDQTEAYRWVQANIASFGGDPARVVIYGQSAGAMSVASHLIREEDKGLFAGALAISEPFALPFRAAPSALAIALELALYAGCPQSPTSAAAACLRAADVDTILAAQIQAQANLTADLGQILQAFMPWCPTHGIPSLPGWPIASFQGLPGSPPVHDVPLIVGTTSSEGTLFIFGGFPGAMTPTTYDLVVDFIFPFGDGSEVQAQYPVPTPPPADLRPLAANLTTDGIFRCATRNATLSLASLPGRKSGLWAYEYSHVLSFGPALWNTTSPYCWDAVCHGEDLPLWWHPDDPQFGTLYTPDEEALSRAMMGYLGNFARTGDPGDGGSGGAGVVWPRLVGGGGGGSPSYPRMQFDVPAVVVRSDPDADMCALFDRMGYTWY
jgi:carboxylesterase type B